MESRLFGVVDRSRTNLVSKPLSVLQLSVIYKYPLIFTDDLISSAKQCRRFNIVCEYERTVV